MSKIKNSFIHFMNQNDIMTKLYLAINYSLKIKNTLLPALLLICDAWSTALNYIIYNNSIISSFELV